MGMNCWEYTGCGYEPGGANAAEGEVCPASVYAPFDGKNNGKNGGRYCWQVVNALCRSSFWNPGISGRLDCVNCGFYDLVRAEEGDAFLM
jgi:hypothetical protein